MLWWNPPSPSWNGDLSVICIRIPISHRISQRCWWGISGGCIQLSECNLPAEILHELLQLMVCKIPKVGLQVLWGSHTRVGVARGRMGFLPPHWRAEIGCQMFPHLPLPYRPACDWQKVKVPTLMASSHNVDAFMTPCAMICNLSMV